MDATTIADAAGPGFSDPIPQDPQQTQYGSYTLCTWTNADAPLSYVRVSVWDRRGAYDDAKQQVSEVNPGRGIGDESFVGSLASVFAVVSGHTLFVQYYDPDRTDAANLSISTALAIAAAQVLGG